MGKIWKKILDCFLVASLFCSSCNKIVKKPEVKSIVLDCIATETIEIIAKAKIYNPNFFPLKIKEMKYAIKTEEMGIAEAETADISLNTADNEIFVSTKIEKSKIPVLFVSYLEKGKTEIMVDFSATFDLLISSYTFSHQEKKYVETNLLSKIEKAKINVDTSISYDPLPFTITIEQLSSKLEAQTRTAEISCVLFNQNPYPLGISKLLYQITSNENSTSETIATNYYLLPNSKNNISITAHLDTNFIANSFVSHFRQECSSLEVLVQFAIEEPTKFVLPILHGKQKIKTDFFPFIIKAEK